MMYPSGISGDGVRRRAGYLAIMAALCVSSATLRAEAPSSVPAAIVRTATPPTIDADLVDWANIQAEHTIQASAAGAAGVAGAFKLAYDADHFYALVRVTDDSPLLNGSSKLQEIMKGGDAVGLMFGPANGQGGYQRVLMAMVDGKPVTMVYRPTSREKRPYTFSSPVSDVTMDYVAPLDEAKVALKPTQDGYIVETAIPWKSLGIQARDGMKLPFDVQIIYSDPGGTTNVGFAWWHSRGDAFTVEDLPTEARLYPDGWGLAQLHAADPGSRQATAAREGNAGPAKTAGLSIELKLPRDGRLSLVITDERGWIVRELRTADSVQAGRHIVEWDGRDRYGEPLPPGTYGWRAMLFDGMGTKFYGSVGNSGRPPFRTADGKGSIGGQHGNPAAVAADAGGIYMLNATEEGHPGMRKIDARTGVSLWKKSYGGFGAGLAVATGDGMACFFNRSGKKGSRNLELVNIDPKTGRDVPMGSAPARYRHPDGEAEVAGLAIVDGRAYYSLPKENRICSVDLRSGNVGPEISVSNPQGLYRLDNRTLLVCSQQQVLKVPVNGGSPMPFITELAEPRAVAVDGAGNVYVSDLGDVQQIRKFDSSGRQMAAFGTPGGKPEEMLTYDPMALRNVTGITIGPDGNLWLVESFAPPKRFIKMTPDGKWLEDFYGPVAYNTFGIDLDDVSRVYYNVLNHYLVETKLDYERYTANPADPASGWKITAIHNMHQQGEVDLGQTVPFGYGHVIAFTAGNGQRYLFRPNKLNRTRSGSAGLYRWAGRWVPAAFLSHTNKPDSSWVDKNGDGMVQKDEMFGPLPTATFSWIDRDLNLYGFDGIISPTGIDSHGVPQYDGGKFTPHFKPGVETCLGDEHNFVSAPAEDGSIYYAVNVGPHRHRSFWDRASETRVVKVKDGEVQWVVGEQSPHPINSELSTLSGIAGSVDEIVLAHVVEPPNYVAFTSDGMTLGNVFGDQTRGARTGPTAIYIESFTGLFIKDPKTGKRLLLSVSSGDDRILEVTGPGKTDRYEGTITLDSARPQAPTTDRIEIPYETLYGNTSRKQGVDGYPYDWQPEARGIPVYNDKGVLVADIRLRRDAGALHVLATVLTKDAIRPDEGIELFLAPNNAQAAGRRVQLIATPEGTKEKYGVFIQSTDAANPTPQPIADAKIAVVPRWRGLGYRLEAEIPLSSFPDLVKDTEQTYRRQGKSKDNRTDIQSYTSTLPDLAGPVRFNAAVRMADGKGVQRIFWLKPGTNAAGPGENAVAWGLATPTPPAAE